MECPELLLSLQQLGIDHGGEAKQHPRVQDLQDGPGVDEERAL